MPHRDEMDFKQTIYICIYTHICFRSGVFNILKAKDPQIDGEIEWGPVTYIYCIKLCFILNWSYSAMYKCTLSLYIQY